MLVVNAVSVAVAWLLLLGAAVLRLRPGGRVDRGPLDRRLSPVEIGLLRGGARGAAQCGLVELYLAGSVEAGWRRTVEPGRARLPRGCSGVARAQFHVLYKPLHPRRLQDSERVRRAVRGVSQELERAGLVVSRGGFGPYGSCCCRSSRPRRSPPRRAGRTRRCGWGSVSSRTRARSCCGYGPAAPCAGRHCSLGCAGSMRESARRPGAGRTSSC
ncbi:TIGR04222 domain-containing membrane protein [Streptomyces lavendulae]|uniref:TIGR04222 domain-containing membrane protein n=1 Tax=Streptomyces lavendulae TaxID=1914 RepID=UPI0024A30A29|nr:TIGR04222 domain-containing membrane protein [Streptomyces lavendulae]GLX23183.1 hypothetical protein Slala01_68270 [Streptomyces lavendulae subsp. lavendulae]GLX30645.1 hypothetical protein Slala02_64650 [Streptomyces lavendulae subsp. lavendulae]